MLETGSERGSLELWFDVSVDPSRLILASSLERKYVSFQGLSRVLKGEHQSSRQTDTTSKLSGRLDPRRLLAFSRHFSEESTGFYDVEM